MKVLLINSVCGIGSTGRICTDLAQQFEKDGHEVKIAYGRENFVPDQFQKYAVRIGSDLDVKLHGIRTRVLDEHGFGSVNATKKFLKWADTYEPDLLWLHNIHGYYINVELLFEWIKSRPDMQVKWTLHDCWAFTGHCTHFSVAKCEQWKTLCQKCPEKDRYPASKLKDNCRKNYVRKCQAFTGVKNMKLITPSKWLADLVKQSFLKEYPVEVCYNTIDKTIFKPTPSDFRKRYGLQEKMIILGVASTWSDRKGLNDFYRLAELLDERYAIVLVGLSEKQSQELSQKMQEVEQETKEKIIFENSVSEENFIYKKHGIVIEPGVLNLYRAVTNLKKEDCSVKVGKTKIVCIPKTSSSLKLAMLYSMADVFVNPTYEDNYPTVNLEAKACGTKVITYNTGGCAETLQ